MAHSKNCNIVADAIERSTAFDQTTWSHCNTPACIGGHTVFELDPGFDHFNAGWTGAYFSKRENVLVKVDIETEAGQLLGLGSLQGSLLFDGSPFAHSKISNMGAAKVLRHLAETDVVDWEKAHGEQ